MTYAPERPGGDALPALLAGHGILPALGHTDADADTAWASLRSALGSAPRGGRPLVTHVFNGMPPMHHRAPGPVAACLAQAARGEAVLEVIGDGVHLDAGTVRMLFDVVGPDGLCLITDAMAASGMPEGTYTLGGRDVVVAGAPPGWPTAAASPAASPRCWRSCGGAWRGGGPAAGRGAGRVAHARPHPRRTRGGSPGAGAPRRRPRRGPRPPAAVGAARRSVAGLTRYLIEPAVRPPTRCFSMNANRITTGTIAMIEAAKSWSQCCT